MLPPAQIRQQTRQSHIHQHRRINAVPLTAYAVASPKKPYKLKPLQLFRRACGTIWYSARTAVAETCRRCCSDSAESAAHHISTVQFAPQAHRASLVGSHQHGLATSGNSCPGAGDGSEARAWLCAFSGSGLTQADDERSCHTPPSPSTI